MHFSLLPSFSHPLFFHFFAFLFFAFSPLLTFCYLLAFASRIFAAFHPHAPTFCPLWLIFYHSNFYPHFLRLSPLVSPCTQTSPLKSRHAPNLTQSPILAIFIIQDSIHTAPKHASAHKPRNPALRLKSPLACFSQSS